MDAQDKVSCAGGGAWVIDLMRVLSDCTNSKTYYQVVQVAGVQTSNVNAAVQAAVNTRLQSEPL